MNRPTISFFRFILLVIITLFVSMTYAVDLKEIKARGTIMHWGFEIFSRGSLLRWWSNPALELLRIFLTVSYAVNRVGFTSELQ